MGESYIEMLKAFGFREMQIWIATYSAMLFSLNLLGGILAALTFVNSTALQLRPLKERIAFRLFLLSEFILWVFVFFYHVFMIETITLSHIIYWISASLMMPLLAVIGSQTIYVAFGSRIAAKEQALKRKHDAERAKRAHDMEKPGGNPAERAMAARTKK